MLTFAFMHHPYRKLVHILFGMPSLPFFYISNDFFLCLVSRSLVMLISFTIILALSHFFQVYSQPQKLKQHWQFSSGSKQVIIGVSTASCGENGKIVYTYVRMVKVYSVHTFWPNCARCNISTLPVCSGTYYDPILEQKHIMIISLLNGIAHW